MLTAHISSSRFLINFQMFPTCRTRVIYQYDLFEHYSRGGVKDAVDRPKESGPGLIVENYNDAGGRKSRAATKLSFHTPGKTRGVQGDVRVIGIENCKTEEIKSHTTKSCFPGVCRQCHTLYWISNTLFGKYVEIIKICSQIFFEINLQQPAPHTPLFTSVYLTKATRLFTHFIKTIDHWDICVSSNVVVHRALEDAKT